MATQLLLGRDPEQSTRTLRFMQQVSNIFNSLALNGTLEETGPQTWALAHLLYTGTGVPAASLAAPGDYYLDLSSGTLYLKS